MRSAGVFAPLWIRGLTLHANQCWGRLLKHLKLWRVLAVLTHSASGSCSLGTFPPQLEITMLSRATDAAGKIRALFYPGERVG